MTRRIFIGDIQGCREELERLLEELRYDPAADELQPVGDLVNRGPDSAGVLRILRDLDAGGVLGNHDVHLLRSAAGTRRLSKRDTLDELLAALDREELLAWLAGRPFVRAWPDVLLVHAGIKPGWADPEAVLAGIDPLIPHPDSDFATRVRYCDSGGARPERDRSHPGPPFEPWDTFLELGARTVVFGHWAVRGLVRQPGLRGLDSGCVWGGSLSAWIAEEDRIVQVPAARAYQGF